MIKQHHVTLKTGVMADENSDLITRINYIKVAEPFFLLDATFDAHTCMQIHAFQLKLDL